MANEAKELSDGETKALLKQHKIKITWLNPPMLKKRSMRKESDSSEVKKATKPQLYPQPVQSFGELRPRFGISSRLAANVSDQGYTTPTEVQLGALPLLLENGTTSPTVANVHDDPRSDHAYVDLLTVAPTGSGKTLAFMIPLLHRILGEKSLAKQAESVTSAIILVPTKELASQISNEGRKLSHGTGVKVSLVRKGMRLCDPVQAQDDDDSRQDDQPGNAATVVKADILVSTPGVLHGMITEVQAASSFALNGVRHLVLDEADVLLDPLFRDQTLGLWNALDHRQLRVSLWSATMGSNIEELARSTLEARRQRLSRVGTEGVPEARLIRLVVGLKDSAVPNVQHKLVYAATEQGKLMGLRQLLHPTTNSAEVGPSLRPPFLVFTQTIERAIALHSELLYDIPAEAGGISRISVLHSDLSDVARDSVMTRFRKGEIWVLITTDLLSRGVDFRGVNGVVNYDVPSSSAAYVHRVGRTGRAGRAGGVAVTLYSKEDIPYLKHVANVVAIAQKQDGASNDNEQDMQRWLLDSLPKLSKQEKHRLKKRGIESRATRGNENDTKATRHSRISSKSGFIRKVENNRKGAILASQRRSQIDDEGDETDFGGFD